MFFRLSFAIFHGFLYTLSLLPFAFWYFISDCLYVVLFWIIGYRKKVAYQNLRRCFPEKTEAEIQSLLKESYRHLCDVFVEFFKEISISKKELERRMLVITPEVFQQIEFANKGVLILATHFGNFEWMSSRTCTATTLPCWGIYAPLKNRYMEALAVKVREKWNGKLLPAKDAIRNSLQRLDEPCVVGFICDQTPSRRQTLYFTDFFGQITAVHDSFAHLALQKEVKVYYADIRKIKRGQYAYRLVPLPMEEFQPYSAENVHRFTDYHVKLLEETIRQQPQYWLWTHKRWKHNPQPQDILSPSLQ